MRLCGLDGCEKRHEAQGFCRNHYRQERNRGALAIVQPPASPEARFFAKVSKSEFCWLWMGAKDDEGYGRFWADGRMHLAHRWIWKERHGQIGKQLKVDHRCGNTSCVNPDHLRLLSNKQNGEHRTRLDSHNTSGARGVTFARSSKRWMAHARHHGKRYVAGYFADFEEACGAARDLRRNLFTHDDGIIHPPPLGDTDTTIEETK